jgi:predicted Zn-dependent protease with MMP-like domain
MILPPSIQQIEAAAQAAIEKLPAAFRSRLQGVVLRVEDWPDDETLDELEIESPYELTGLYRGHTVAESGYSGQLPDTIHLYRRPILDEWADGTIPLETLVAHVVIHEIGHHFGLTDDDIDAIEASVPD